MSKYKIITVPDKILRRVSDPLEKVSHNEKKLSDDLIEIMYKNNGIGLAAIQIGIPKRMIVIDIEQKNKKKNPICFINPKIKKFEGKNSSYEEGCLSIPNTFIEIERPEVCYVEYIDIEGTKKEIKCEGLLSTCIQHEINHLDGKLIIDFVSKMKRDLIVKKLSKNKINSDRIIV